MKLKTVTAPDQMTRWAKEMKGLGQTLGLVPTMGYFHAGHLALFKAARAACQKVAISIFVNPLQFSPGEDLERYPRDLARDLALAEKEEVDVLFCPSVGEMYPTGFQTTLGVGPLGQRLCGLGRPGHFDGVATVVAKLFNIVAPQLAFFGRKDYQQLLIVKQLVKDLHFDISVVEVPIVRDFDGLALSSRNTYLTEEERQQALALYEGILLSRQLFLDGETSAQALLKELSIFFHQYPLIKIDYAKACHPLTLEDVSRIEEGTLLALALWVGQTRLIDNYIFGEEI